MEGKKLYLYAVVSTHEIALSEKNMRNEGNLA